MKVGLFDHVEWGERPLAQLFDERLQFAAAAEAAGIYCLHVAEHHATPSSKVAPRGTPRRASAAPTPCFTRFIDAFECLSAGLTTDMLTYAGPHYSYDKVPIALRPLQQPHPAFWYGSSNPTGSTWAGERGMHFLSLGPTGFAKKNIDAFRQALARRGGPASPKPEFSGGAAIGVQRHIFVADTDAEARRFAKPAMEYHLANLNWLRVKHGVGAADARLGVPRGATFEDGVADGSVIAGSPQTVWEAIERQSAELGINYLLTYLFLGTMSLAEALRSLELFGTEVMPKIAKL